MNGGKVEQYWAIMRNISRDIFSRLQESACDMMLATLSMQGAELGVISIGIKISLGKNVSFSAG